MANKLNFTEKNYLNQLQNNYNYLDELMENEFDQDLIVGLEYVELVYIHICTSTHIVNLVMKIFLKGWQNGVCAYMDMLDTIREEQLNSMHS